MKLLILVPALLLTACTAVPVKREFPKVPELLLQPCVQLTEIPPNTKKLSDVLVTVTNNYSLYHECQIKVETWQQWYKTQKEIFDSVK